MQITIEPVLWLVEVVVVCLSVKANFFMLFRGDWLDMRNATIINILFVALLASASVLTTIEAAAAQKDTLLDRSERAVDWVSQQAVTYEEGMIAFADETDTFDGRVYTEANARVAWMFQNHYQHLTSRKYEQQFQSAVNFVLTGQAATGDFNEYFDIAQRSWSNSGKLHYWNAFVSAMLSLTAINMRRLPELGIKHEYWTRVISRVETFVERWSDSGLQRDGSWVFTYNDGVRPGIAENGMMLATLSCLSAYEFRWGDRVKGTGYSTIAKKTASWLLDMQEMDQSKWSWGGFYEDRTRTMQISLPNARAMHGILVYWEFISVSVESDPSLYDMLRERLVAWAEGFFGKMRDDFGGPYFQRDANGASKYPKRTLEAAEFIRDIGIIWVDHGEPKYWSWTELTCQWLFGNNEAQTDLQQAKNLKGQTGGFYVGIQQNASVDQRSTTLAVSICAEAMLYALYIDVPEFHRSGLVAAILIIGTLILTRRRRVARNQYHRISERLVQKTHATRRDERLPKISLLSSKRAHR